MTHRQSRIGGLVAATVVLVQLWAGFANAQDDTKIRVEQLYADGAALFKAGKYRLAIEKFYAAYEAFPDPRLLFNIARSQEAMGNIEQAAKTYEQCVEHPRADADLKDKASRRLTMVQRAQARSRAARTESPVQKEPLPADEVAPAGASVVAGIPERESRGPSPFVHIGKWVFGGAGLAMAIAGAGFFFAGVADHDDLDDLKTAAGESVSADTTRVEALQLQQDGKDKKIIGYGLLGGGAALVLTSALLFVFDRQPESSTEKSAATVRVAAAPAPGGAAFSLQGVF